MAFVLPKPKIVTRNGEPAEVILSYADWQKIVAILDEKDAEDIAAVEAARREDNQLAARISAQRGTSVETTIPFEVVQAKINGTHPLKAWREFRRITQLDLSSRSGVERDLVAQIESHQKRAGLTTLEQLARALGIPTESLIADED